MSREMLEGYASLGRRMSLLLLLCSGNLPVASMQACKLTVSIPFRSRFPSGRNVVEQTGRERSHKKKPVEMLQPAIAAASPPASDAHSSLSQVGASRQGQG